MNEPKIRVMNEPKIRATITKASDQEDIDIELSLITDGDEYPRYIGNIQIDELEISMDYLQLIYDAARTAKEAAKR